MDAGKEVTRLKHVKDKQGKEFALFMAPKPIKGKPWDKTVMYSGQLQSLIKKAEAGNKCAKQLGTKRKAQDPAAKAKRQRADRARRGVLRGTQHYAGVPVAGTPAFRGRSQRNLFGRGPSFLRGGAK